MPTCPSAPTPHPTSPQSKQGAEPHRSVPGPGRGPRLMAQGSSRGCSGSLGPLSRVENESQPDVFLTLLDSKTEFFAATLTSKSLCPSEAGDPGSCSVGPVSVVLSALFLGCPSCNNSGVLERHRTPGTQAKSCHFFVAGDKSGEKHTQPLRIPESGSLSIPKSACLMGKY